MGEMERGRDSVIVMDIWETVSDDDYCTRDVLAPKDSEREYRQRRRRRHTHMEGDGATLSDLSWSTRDACSSETGLGSESLGCAVGA